MNSVNSQNYNEILNRLGDGVVREIIDVFYDNMLEDYRINRFFNRDNEDQQKDLLYHCINTVMGANSVDEEGVKEVLDDYFLHAFSRSKRKSFVAGSDFNFLGMVADQDQPNPNPLCDGHKALLKFLPEDFHYDVVLENLDAALTQLHVESKLAQDVLKVAAGARDKVLGK